MFCMDTHAVYWRRIGSKKLSGPAGQIFDDESSELPPALAGGWSDQSLFASAGFSRAFVTCL